VRLGDPYTGQYPIPLGDRGSGHPASVLARLPKGIPLDESPLSKGAEELPTRGAGIRVPTSGLAVLGFGRRRRSNEQRDERHRWKGTWGTVELRQRNLPTLPEHDIPAHSPLQ
jgi:hypothetical protein